MMQHFYKKNECSPSLSKKSDTFPPSRQRFVADRYWCRHNFRQKSSKYFSISQNRRTFALS